MKNFIVLLMVCAPSLAVVNSPKAAGRRILTAEFIDDKLQVYKLEVWDETKITIIHQLLTGMHDMASKGGYYCPIGFPLASDDGLFLVQPSISEYDKNKGYRFAITVQKGTQLSEKTAPFVPSQSMLVEYMKANQITKPINEWNAGYIVKMYVPYSKRLNLQQVVAAESIRSVSTRNGMKDLLEVHLISGVPKEGSIKLSLWGCDAHLMHGVLKEYVKTTQNPGGPVVLWNTLNLHDAHGSCYMDKYQGNLIITKKLNSPPFEPPQLVTCQHAKSFIDEHGLHPLDRWHLDKPSVGSPSATIYTVTSPSFDSASFLKQQQERLCNIGSPSSTVLHFADEDSNPVTPVKNIAAGDDKRLTTADFAEAVLNCTDGEQSERFCSPINTRESLHDDDGKPNNGDALVDMHLNKRSKLKK